MRPKFLMPVLAFLFALAAAPAFAQDVTPTPQTRLAFDAGTNWSAVGVTGFKLYVDNNPAVDLGALTSDAAGTYVIPFPALTPGTHTLSVTAYNNAGESDKAVLTLRVVIVPDTPRNFRIASAELLDPATGRWIPIVIG